MRARRAPDEERRGKVLRGDATVSERQEGLPKEIKDSQESPGV